MPTDKVATRDGLWGNPALWYPLGVPTSAHTVDLLGYHVTDASASISFLDLWASTGGYLTVDIASARTINGNLLGSTNGNGLVQVGWSGDPDYDTPQSLTLLGNVTGQYGAGIYGNVSQPWDAYITGDVMGPAVNTTGNYLRSFYSSNATVHLTGNVTGGSAAAGKCWGIHAGAVTATGDAAYGSSDSNENYAIYGGPCTVRSATGCMASPVHYAISGSAKNPPYPAVTVTGNLVFNHGLPVGSAAFTYAPASPANYIEVGGIKYRRRGCNPVNGCHFIQGVSA